MKRKIWYSFLLGLIMVLGLTATANANTVVADTNQVAPRYSFIESIIVAASIDGDSGYLSADVVVQTYETCKMEATVKLQRKNGLSWTTIKTWDVPSSGTPYKGSLWQFNKSTYVDTSETYQIVATATVTSTETGRSESGTATQSRIPINY